MSDVENLARIFKVLSVGTRVRIVQLLKGQQTTQGQSCCRGRVQEGGCLLTLFLFPLSARVITVNFGMEEHAAMIHWRVPMTAPNFTPIWINSLC